jgi:ribosome-associated protein
VSLDSLRPEVRWAIEAAQNKQALDVTVLDLKNLGAFAEYFVLCTGTSDPQMQAICGEIEEQLDRHGVRLAHREGQLGSDWVLLDYGSFVVHILSARARLFYDLERLWRAARRYDVPHPGPTASPSSEAAGK